MTEVLSLTPVVSGALPLTVSRSTPQSEATLGTNILLNGDFATGDFTNWTAGAGWSVVSNRAKHTSGNTAALTQSIAVTSGQTYVIYWDDHSANNPATGVTATAGRLTVSIGGVSETIDYYMRNATTLVAAGSSGTQTFSISPTTDYDGLIGSIRVREVVAIVPPALVVENGDGSVGLEMRPGGTGLENTAVGYQALQTNATGVLNTAVGAQALAANTDGGDNVAVGHQAMAANTTGVGNVAVGYQAMLSNTNGLNNHGLGSGALQFNTNGSNNVALGTFAMNKNTTGQQNTAVGIRALQDGTTASNNTAIGYQAGQSLTTAQNNTVAGYNSFFAATTAANNVAIGKDAGYQPNTVVGNATVAGARNVFVGYQSGASSAADPSDATALGYKAIVANGSIAIGSQAQATGSGAIALGNGVVTAVANQIAIGSATQHILLKTAAAPADASFAASQFTLWLDATAGASKLMVKAKNASGTVVAGSVTLS